MNLTTIITAVCSLLFFMVGADKFFSFLDPPCSLETSISPIIWKLIGALQLATGILIWMPKYRKYVIVFFFVFMVFFTLVHLFYGTYDVGGAVFMAVLLGLLYWRTRA